MVVKPEEAAKLTEEQNEVLKRLEAKVDEEIRSTYTPPKQEVYISIDGPWIMDEKVEKRLKQKIEQYWTILDYERRSFGMDNTWYSLRLKKK